MKNRLLVVSLFFSMEKINKFLNVFIKVATYWLLNEFIISFDIRSIALPIGFVSLVFVQNGGSGARHCRGVVRVGL